MSAGRRKKVRVKLNKAGKALLASQHRLNVGLVVKVKGKTVFSKVLHFKG